MHPRIISVVAVCLLASLIVHAQARKSHDWLTWGGDVERSGWNRSETALSKTSVRNLELKWKTQIDKQVPIEIESGAAMLTAPLVVEGVRTSQGTKSMVLTLAASNTVAALDPATGKIIWQRTFENTVQPANAATWVCTNTSTATPVIDKSKGLVYLISADGRLHGLSLGTGEEELQPVDFVPPFSRNWSLNLVNGVLYTTVGRGCGNGVAPASRGAAPAGANAAPAGGGAQRGPARLPPVASHMIAIDLNDLKKPVARFATSTSRPYGAWSRAGYGVGPETRSWCRRPMARGDPAANQWGETLLRLAPKSLQLIDYFTPPNMEELNTLDLDYGSGGVVAFTDRNRPMVVSGGKDGTIYLLDGAALGGADHRTPLFSLKIGNDAMLYASNGIWGAPATVARFAQPAMVLRADVGSARQSRRVQTDERRGAGWKHHGPAARHRRRQAGAVAHVGLP